MSFVAAIVAAISLVLTAHHREHLPPQHHHHRHHHRRVHHAHHWTVYTYARERVLHHWRSAAEWGAFAQIVRNESGWDPCAHYPSTHDCRYEGVNACGIPQRDPCPGVWRGRLYAMRFRMVDWMVRYIDGRYGTPGVALYHETHGSY